MPGRVDEYELLLSQDPIFMDRTRGIKDGLPRGRDQVRHERALPAGLRDPLRHPRRLPLLEIRAVPVRRPFSTEGDVYAQYMVRVREMRESVRIIRQGLEAAAGDAGAPIRLDNPRIAFPKRDKIHTSMESLIHHFKLVSEGPVPRRGGLRAGGVAPGELGRTSTTARTSPTGYGSGPRGSTNLQALPQLTAGRLVADVVACIGSIDIVLGRSTANGWRGARALRLRPRPSAIGVLDAPVRPSATWC